MKFTMDIRVPYRWFLLILVTSWPFLEHHHQASFSLDSLVHDVVYDKWMASSYWSSESAHGRLCSGTKGPNVSTHTSLGTWVYILKWVKYSNQREQSFMAVESHHHGNILDALCTILWKYPQKSAWFVIFGCSLKFQNKACGFEECSAAQQ